MDYWQRGTSGFLATSSLSSYSADRWKGEAAGVSVNVTSSRDASVPFPIFPYSLKSIITGASGVVQGACVQRIEADMISHMVGKNMTLTFWMKGAGILTSCNIEIRTPASLAKDIWGARTSVDDTIKSSSVVTLSSDWQKFSHTFEVPAEAVYGMSFVAKYGSATLSDGIFITGVQLEEGVSASNFERAGGNIANELQLCQRYYEKSYNLTVDPGSISSFGGVTIAPERGVTQGNLIGGASYKTPKRSASVVVVYNPVTGAANSVRYSSSNYAVSYSFAAGEKSFSLINNTGVAWPSSGTTACYFHYTADAEL